MKYCPECRIEYFDEITSCAECGASLVKELLPEEKMPPLKQLVTIFVSTYGAEAHVVKTFLESSGLHPVVHDENLVLFNPLYSNAIGGVKVLVPGDEEGEAKECIEEHFRQEKTISSQDISGEEKEEMCCPRCGCSEIIRKPNLDKSVFFIYLLSLIGLLMLPFFRKVNVCMNCGYKWKNSERTP